MVKEALDPKQNQTILNEIVFKTIELVYYYLHIYTIVPMYRVC